MKLSSKSSRRIRISALWLVFLVLTNSLLFHILKTRQYNDTKSALLDQAGIVTGQIPVLVENEISTRIGRDINQEKLNTLAYVLG